MIVNKRFNTVGVCVPRKHYMVDISDKLRSIKELIDQEFYFTINKPRQYGKTTTLNELKKKLKEEYLVVSISFEGIGDSVFENEESFCKKFLKIMSKSLIFTNPEASERLIACSQGVKDLEETSEAITRFVQGEDKEVILFIDEVDKSSNNQLFLSFIGMLRNKYLAREVDEDFTFKSVVLVGMYDVKSLKVKLRKEEEAKYNSPWNIAVDFEVDMSFSKREIASMLEEYCLVNQTQMDIMGISAEIYFYTKGYPFLVSRIGQIIDEKIYEHCGSVWHKADVTKAIKIMNEETNTLFESIVKNLENNIELYRLVQRILVDGEQVVFNPLEPSIKLGVTHGILAKGEHGVEVSNKIFEEVIYNYMVSKLVISVQNMTLYNVKSSFVKKTGELDIEKVLCRFGQFMKEQYSTKDQVFLEHHGRLLFLAFIKPIINGTGFDFKEVQISEEKRLDLVITYNQFRYIIEMKIWRGEKYHQEGIKQLYEYLEIHGVDKGYLLVFDFNKNKEFREERRVVEGKEIFEVYV